MTVYGYTVNNFDSVSCIYEGFVEMLSIIDHLANIYSKNTTVIQPMSIIIL